jgi:hypothetical protein
MTFGTLSHDLLTDTLTLSEMAPRTSYGTRRRRTSEGDPGG